jgi:hydrogenase nickel incorporation protein HypA/HybF
MHELSVTEQVLRAALAHAEAHHARRITGIRLRVGEWASIVPESVEYYFGIVSQETIASGAKLSFEIVPLRARCGPCGQVFDPAEAFVCPACGSAETAIDTGRELEIESIEVST